MEDALVRDGMLELVQASHPSGQQTLHLSPYGMNRVLHPSGHVLHLGWQKAGHHHGEQSQEDAAPVVVEAVIMAVEHATGALFCLAHQGEKRGTNANDIE